MSAHTCKTLTPGCYRCELNEDEIHDYLLSLRVTRSGVVHEAWCSFINGSCVWTMRWIGSPLQDYDRACKRCMPEGLPDLSILT